MTAQHNPHPTWTVQSVYDPERTGQDFSYTIGLHARGLPELHLWGRPTTGDDPGEDWLLSYRDRQGILNATASRLVAGTLSVGSSWTEAYDGGAARVTFTLGPPGDRDLLQALGIAPGAEVLPLTWSLVRPPVGAPVELDGAARMVAWDDFHQLVRPARRRQVTPPPGWEIPVWPEFDQDSRFGPRTPVVLARAAQLWTATDLGPLLRTLLPHAAEDSLLAVHPLASAAARAAGRVDAVRALEDAVPDLVDWTVAADRERWTDALVAVEPELAGLSMHERARATNTARRWLMQATLAVLVTEVVHDVADDHVRLAGRGPWMAGFADEAMVPGAEWAASTPIVRAVKKLLRPLDHDAWAQLADTYDEGRRDADGDYNELAWRLTLLLQTTACAMPWAKLADLPVARALVEGLPGPLRRQVVWRRVEEWASCVSALLVHRASFSNDDVTTFVDPVRDVVPDLERVLNRLR